MKKRFLCLLLSLTMCVSMASPAFASDTSSEENLPVLIDSEVKIFNGVETRIDYYTQNGANITAYTVLDKSISQSDMNSTIDAIKCENEAYEQNAPIAVASTPTPTATKDFDDEDSNPTTVRASVSHHGTFCKSNIDLAYLWAEDVKTEVEFSDPEITPEITVQRSFEVTGVDISLSISWPLGVGVGLSKDSYAYSSVGPFSANFLIIDWSTPYSSSVAGTGFSLTLISDVSFYAKDEGRVYSGYVSTKQNFQTGW